MMLINGFIRVAPENAGKLKEAAAKLIAATREERGCLAYAFSEDIAEPGVIHIAERWADQAALDAHNKTPHLAAFMGALPTFGVLGLRLAKYDAPAEQMLAGG
jgi:quinol monooxygenase YgiN